MVIYTTWNLLFHFIPQSIRKAGNNLKNLVTRTIEQLENPDICTDMIVRSIQEETGDHKETGDILSQATETWCALMDVDSYFLMIEVKEQSKR